MRRRAVLAVAVALLAVLAGCSLGGSPGPGPTTSPTGTDTTTTTTAPPPDPPGVDDGSLADPGTLLDAHVSALVENGFAYEATVNGTALRELGGETQVVEVARRETAYVEANASGYHRITLNRAFGSRIDTWANETTEVVLLRVGDRSRFQVGEPAEPGSLTAVGLIGPYVRASTFDVAGTSGNMVTLVADGLEPEANRSRLFPPGAENVSDYRARLVLDRAGRVRTLQVTANYSVAGEPAALDLDFELTATGGVTVGPPDWLSALERAGSGSTTTTATTTTATATTTTTATNASAVPEPEPERLNAVRG